MPRSIIAGQTHGARVGAVRAQREPAAENGSHHVLPLGADVPEIGAEAIGQADGDERERRRLDDELLERPRVAQRPADVDLEGGERRAAHEPDHHAGDEEGDQEGGNGREHAGDARHLGARRELKPHARSRVRRPSSRARSRRGSTRPSAAPAPSSPPRITAMRSAISNSSSRSWLMTRTAGALDARDRSAPAG